MIYYDYIHDLNRNHIEVFWLENNFMEPGKGTMDRERIVGSSKQQHLVDTLKLRRNNKCYDFNRMQL